MRYANLWTREGNSKSIRMVEVNDKTHSHIQKMEKLVPAGFYRKETTEFNSVDMWTEYTEEG